MQEDFPSVQSLSCDAETYEFGRTGDKPEWPTKDAADGTFRRQRGRPKGSTKKGKEILREGPTDTTTTTNITRNQDQSRLVEGPGMGHSEVETRHDSPTTGDDPHFSPMENVEDRETSIGASYDADGNASGGTRNEREKPEHIAEDSVPVKRPRGRPKGSTKKRNSKAKQSASFEFITTDVVISQNPSHAGSPTEHAYEMVRVTISPCENPPILSQHRMSCDVPPMAIAGPSVQPQLLPQIMSPTALESSTDNTSSTLSDLVGMVRSLAKEVKKGAKDVDTKAGGFSILLQCMHADLCSLYISCPP